MADVFDLCQRNDEFANDCFTNPDLFRSAVAIVDRMILIYGYEIGKAKIDGPMGVEGFDLMFKLGVKEA